MEGFSEEPQLFQLRRVDGEDRDMAQAINAICLCCLKRLPNIFASYSWRRMDASLACCILT